MAFIEINYSKKGRRRDGGRRLGVLSVYKTFLHFNHVLIFCCHKFVTFLSVCSHAYFFAVTWKKGMWLEDMVGRGSSNVIFSVWAVTLLDSQFRLASQNQRL